jgi:lipopolysaccharide transport system ATP-binding protein
MSAIRFDHVSKEFTLHHERPRSFQELFLSLIHSERTPKKEKYGALRDVSFEVKPGEMVGIIGPNGAGKSTILKLITRIIEPTSGQIQVDGRVGALLELGAGFHPDLTGRENVYLNGSILGFGRVEMDRLFDDIVSFSEMGRFIDVPVKHYSSGMFMRLGFSVAINLRPDILLVDEVLSVGDQAFQLRCLDKINAMKRQGVTIILVTHSHRQVSEMCSRAIWLDEGRIRAEGPVEHVLDEYMLQVANLDQQMLHNAEALNRTEFAPTASRRAPGKDRNAEERKVDWRWGTREVEVVAVQILDEKDCEQRSFQTGDTLTVRIHYAAHTPIREPRFGLALYHSSGFHISGPNNVFAGYAIGELAGSGYVDYTVESLPLLPGTYLISAAIYDHEGTHAYDHMHQRFTFRVRPGGVHEQFGSVYIPASWRWTPVPANTDVRSS